MDKVKIVVFAWCEGQELFNKFKLPYNHNEEFFVSKDKLNNKLCEISTVCFNAGLNIKWYKVPGKEIVWIKLDTERFHPRSA